MFRRLWVRIPGPYSGWTFSHLLVIKFVVFVWKDAKNEKEARVSHF